MSILIDEKNKKEREERAKNLISQRSISDSINTVNYAKMKNINLNPQSDEEKNFISKVDRANSLISSINPREDVPEPTLTDEEKAQSEENIKLFLELIDKNRNEDKIENISNSDAIQEYNQNNNQKNIMVQPSMERIIKQSEERHQEELKKDEAMPIINQKINDNSNIKADQNISSNINTIENETNNVAKNGTITLTNKSEVNNLQTDIDYKLQQQKNEKSNSNVFEKGITWFKDFLGSTLISVYSKASRIRKIY